MDASRLKEISLFARLSQRERNKLTPRLREVEIPRGDHLVDEGQFGYEFFVIEEGRAAVVSGSRHVADLGPGDFLGEIALVRRGLRTASVIATSDIKAVVMGQDEFQEMTRSTPRIAREIDAAIEERLERNRMFGVNRE